MPIDRAHIRKRKKKIPPAIGVCTRFSKTAAEAEIIRIPIMARRFLAPQVRERITLVELATAPYAIADRRVVSWIVSSQVGIVWKKVVMVNFRIPEEYINLK